LNVDNPSELEKRQNFDGLDKACYPRSMDALPTLAESHAKTLELATSRSVEPISPLAETVPCLACSEPADRESGYCARHDARRLATRADILNAAADAIERGALEYVAAHRQATRIAALKGDSKPAEWALLHTRVVKPVEKEAAAAGLIVNVGVMLPGLPPASE
jgi:hypothetical protein